MRKLSLSLALIGCIVTSTLPIGSAYEAQQASVKIDLSAAGYIKESTSYILGTNNDWPATSDFIMQDQNSIKPNEEFLNFWHTTGVPATNSRQGGATSMHYRWMNHVGELDERVPDGYMLNYGIAEWIKSVLQVNPNAGFTPVLNIYDSPEQCADLVRYLTLNPGDANAVNPNTGINWAQRRVDDGIKDPVNVIAFELGNELYGDFNEKYGAPEWKDGLPAWSTINYRMMHQASQYPHYRAAVTNAATAYAEYCKPYIDVIRAVDPNVPLSVNAHAAAEIDRADECTHIWNSIVIETLRDYCGGHCGDGCEGSCYGRGINFVSHHDYYWMHSKHSQTMEGTYGRISRYFEGRDIKIMVTEHNLLTNGLSTSLTPEGRIEEIKKESTVAGSLSIADFLVSAYNVPELYSANHHGTFELAYTRPWGLGRKFTSGQKYVSGEKGLMYSSVTGQMMALINEAVGGKVMKTQATDVITSAHLKDDGPLDVVFLNRNSNNITVNINITGTDTKYRLESFSMINGSADALNDPLTPEGAVVRSTLVNGMQECKSFNMPAYSMATLHLVPEDFAIVTDTVGKVKFRNNGSTLQIWDKLYKDTGAKYGSEVGVVVLKNGADPENYSLSDIYIHGQTTIINDIAYFEVPIGADFESGVYPIIIGNDDFTHIVKYNTCDIEDVDFINSYDVVEANGITYDNISNDDYTVELSAVFGENVPQNATIGSTVVYGDKTEISDYSDANLTRVAFADEVKMTDGTCNIAVDMPKGALSGVYTVILGISSEKSNGTFAKSFYFTKPDEDIMLLAPPHTADGKDITLVSDMSHTVYVELKRLNGTGNADVFIGYYNNGVLVNALATDAVFGENGEASVVLNSNNASGVADCIKLFVWSDDANSPLIHTYSVKQ